MGEGPPAETSVIGRADFILGNLGLSWADLRGKDVLDVGSGDSALAQAATVFEPSARIFSHDNERKGNWAGLPFQVKSRLVQADSEALPFADGSFDYVVAHGLIDPLAMIDAPRVLRTGGELRAHPIGGVALEFWNISYYLDQEKHWDHDRITAYLEGLNQRFDIENGTAPKEFVNIREEAMDMLSPGQKLDVLDMIVERNREITGIPFDYSINDPMAREPNGVLIYRKE